MKVEMQLGSEKLSIETGKVAKQADGAVWVQYGGTVVLVTVVADDSEHDLDFFPLTVDYRERAYAHWTYTNSLWQARATAWNIRNNW